MFVSTDFPKLKGKAAEIRHLLGPLHHVFSKHMNGGNKVHRHIALALKLSYQMEQILDQNADVYSLPARDAASFKKAAFGFLALQTTLGHHFHTTVGMLFHTTVKSHWLAHAACLAAHQNPRSAWTYSGEDFLQRLKKLVIASSAGTPPHQVVGKVMHKYCFAVGLDLADQADWWQD
jgi:hypothetical protein